MYISEGFDDDRLDTLFIIPPISWRSAVAQYVGRLHRLMEVDLLSRELCVAVELDGPQHLADVVASRRGRRKDRLLQGHGYLVLRFFAEDVAKGPGRRAGRNRPESGLRDLQ
jgi:superfamily II DNA or RNA helicase